MDPGQDVRGREVRAGLLSPRLACHRCDWSGGLDLRQACPECGATLRVAHAAPRPGWEGDGLWRYRSWLPPARDPVTLGEGGTPLIEALGALLKDEARNPTLSFKDRPVSVAATMARDLGAEGLLCASSGNTAVSVAAYAARACLPSVCVVPAATPAAKLRMATEVGASVLRVDGDYSAAHALARALAGRLGWANLTSTYLNPYMLEGDKTVAFELYEQLGGRLPDAIVVPIGAGPLLAAIGQGVDELAAAGRVEARPRLYGVQAAGCAPIAAACESGTPVEPWSRPLQTRAGSIADALDGYPDDGQRTLDCALATGGAVLAVGDDALEAAAGDLRRRAGLSVELGAAAALAGWRALLADGRASQDERAVLVLTGHGVKDDPGPSAEDDLGTVAPGDVEAAEAALSAAATRPARA